MAFWAAPAESYAMSAAAGLGCYARVPDHPWSDPCCLYDDHESIIKQRKVSAAPATAEGTIVLGVPCSAAYQRPAAPSSKDCHYMTYCTSSSFRSTNERTISGRTDDSQESTSSTSSSGSWLSPVLGWYANHKEAKHQRKMQHKQAKAQYVSERAKWRSTVRGHMLKGK